jgi:hypothetical protein
MEQTLTAEMESVLNKLALQMTDMVNGNSDTRIKNLEIISANLNKKPVYLIQIPFLLLLFVSFLSPLMFCF